MSSGTGSESCRSVLIVLGLLVLILAAGWGYTYYALSGEVTAGNSSIANATSRLQSQISSLNSQLSSYQSPFLFGAFTFTTSGFHGLFGGNWVYTIDGPYANFGADTANSATVTFIFYSGHNHTGQVYCQTTVILGNIIGRSVNELPQTVCNSNSRYGYKSWTWNFASGNASFAILYNSTLKATSFLDSYSQNAVHADALYTGNELYLSGEVLNVEQSQSGSYKSCFGINGSSDCRFQSAGDMIVWNWANQSVAEQVPTNYAPFVAECIDRGYQNGNLFLNNCLIVGSEIASVTTSSVATATINSTTLTSATRAVTGSPTNTTAIEAGSTGHFPISIVFASSATIFVVIGAAAASYLRRMPPRS